MAEVSPYKPVSNRVLDAWGHRLNEAFVNADRANERFKARTAELKQHIANHPNAYRDETTIRNKLIDDIDRRDALDDYSFSCSEVQRIAARIQAEVNLREMRCEQYVK